MSNEAKRHHYVPRFYLKRFSDQNNIKKVMTVERHGEFIVGSRKSIRSIGYEVGLHDAPDPSNVGSMEGELNDKIETPFSSSSTWKKISAGSFADLDERDGLSIYGFARHLQRRNIATQRFIAEQNARFLAGGLVDVTPEEKAMHEWLADHPDAKHRLFRSGALDTALPEDAGDINILICRSPIKLRSSTNPTLIFSHPGEQSIFGSMFNDLRTWWLTLDRHWGVFIVLGGPSGFSIDLIDADVARVVNRRYLVQMTQGAARYVLADDNHLHEDLEWAGGSLVDQAAAGFRYALPNQ